MSAFNRKMMIPDGVVVQKPCVCPQREWGEISSETCINSYHGNRQTVLKWLAEGGDINATTNLGYTFLSAICANGNVDTLTWLLQNNDLHLNIKNQWGQTPLMVAVHRGNEGIVRHLLNTALTCKIDLTVLDKNNMTALGLAAQEKNWVVVDLLLQPDIRYDMETLDLTLFKAAECEKWKVVGYLLDQYRGFEEETISLVLEKASAKNSIRVADDRRLGMTDIGGYLTPTPGRAPQVADGRRLEITGTESYLRPTPGRVPQHELQIIQQRISVKVSSTVMSPAPDVYDTTTIPRGLVLILNYNNFEGRPNQKRNGSTQDVKNLLNLCDQMGYLTEVHTNLTKERTIQIVESFSRQDRLNDVGCAIVTIMSHGFSRHTFLASDMQHIEVPQIQNYFLENVCPALKNKPKIFLLNFCRGDDTPAIYDSDSIREQPRNMLCIYSTTENFRSYRDTERGCPFIFNLCEVIADHAYEMDLDDLIRKFQKVYHSSSTPEVQNLGFHKKFYFNPIGSAHSST
ncbi:caspase-1-like isoform X3 [Homarus americanus]|uniref:caspase-1-like isoform X3 n=1 Tax=Homarus americanus TaxID=6706 RepID=UPI001C4498D3|nr:caspase-1-like isoform X3 [Homarus americanus]